MRNMKNILISLTFVLCFAGSDSSARERTPVPELDLPTAEAVLRVFAGKSLLVTSPETLERSGKEFTRRRQAKDAFA